MNKVLKALLAMKEAADKDDTEPDSHHTLAIEALEELALKWQYKPNPTHLTLIAVMVAHWMARHGGVASGYNTHVNGRVSVNNNHGYLEVVLPGDDDRTVRQNREMGCELYKLVQTYMRTNQFGPDDAIMFCSQHLGNDRYKMSVMYLVEKDFEAGLHATQECCPTCQSTGAVRYRMVEGDAEQCTDEWHTKATNIYSDASLFSTGPA